MSSSKQTTGGGGDGDFSERGQELSGSPRRVPTASQTDWMPLSPDFLAGPLEAFPKGIPARGAQPFPVSSRQGAPGHTPPVSSWSHRLFFHAATRKPGQGVTFTNPSNWELCAHACCL